MPALRALLIAGAMLAGTAPAAPARSRTPASPTAAPCWNATTAPPGGARSAAPPAAARAQAPGGFACEGKRTCRGMASCAEARFYLSRCGAGQLDRDNDGVPCESICR